MAINRRDIIQMLKEENKLLKSSNQQLAHKLTLLQQAFRGLQGIAYETRTLSATHDVVALFKQMLELVLHTCNTENGSLIMLDDEAQQLEFVEVIGESRNALMNHRLNADTGIVGNAIKTGQAILIEDVHDSTQWSSSIDDYLSFHAKSLMCVPLKIGNRIIGAIELVRHNGDGVFDENDLNVLKVAACYVSGTLEQAEKLITSGGD